MRKGDKVVIAGRSGVYVRRDMKRFLPFLVRFDDDGSEAWIAWLCVDVLNGVAISHD